MMSDINKLFFELILVAIGKQRSLSRLPQADEWGELYKMVKKQALVGVCFAALQKLRANADEGFTRIGISKTLYMTWMGMTFMIQRKNEAVNQQCSELQTKLSVCGIKNCLLKGQGVGQLYAEDLRGLRQSGDIDLWIDGAPEDTIARLKGIGIELSNINIKHADAKVFEDTKLEIHFVPSWFYNPVTSKHFKSWIKEQTEEQMAHEHDGLITPTVEFNVVYLLLHIYRHLLDEGVGMRQLMDYFFVLKALPLSQKDACYDTICKFGMKRIASAVMWVIQEVFGIDQKHLLCEPDSHEGALILNEVMMAGNFGHHDKRIGHEHRGAFCRGWMNFCRNMRFVTRYPKEVLCAPFWKLWHWGWRKRFN